MTNDISQNSEDNITLLAKRRRVSASVAQGIVSSDDDDNISDGMDICNVLENETKQRALTTKCCAIHALGKTIRNTLLEINEIREQNRERRHRELLQVLTKMVQQGNMEREVTENSETAVNENKYLNEIKVEHDFLENKDFSNAGKDSSDDNTGAESAAGSSSSKFTKLIPKSQITHKQYAAKIKSAVKHDETKKELQKMRAQMLKLQREKMEDRERKKREYLQIQNI